MLSGTASEAQDHAQKTKHNWSSATAAPIMHHHTNNPNIQLWESAKQVHAGDVTCSCTIATGTVRNHLINNMAMCLYL
jgi:hypothetical protein